MERSGYMPVERPAARELRQLVAVSETFASLMDHPATFPAVDEVLDRQATLADAGYAQVYRAGSPAMGAWHRDGEEHGTRGWIRCTFLLQDLGPGGGPTAYIPGSHRRPSAPPPSWNRPDGQPHPVPGAELAVGKAGDCIINFSSIWHTPTPNASGMDRWIIGLLYKPRTDPQWDDGGLGYACGPDLVKMFDDPVRQRLVSTA